MPNILGAVSTRPVKASVSGRLDGGLGAPPSNGFILYEHATKPLCLVLTGTRRASKNPKTGHMLQTWLMRTDVHPMEAAKTGLDRMTCNGCELRPIVSVVGREAGLLPSDSPMCYVNILTVAAVWRAYRDGSYPLLPLVDYEKTFLNQSIRLGSYGNLSNLPFGVVERIIESGPRNWTMYDHNWRARHARPFARYAMASVSSLEAATEANDSGWRTFRLTRDIKDLRRNEVICPASPEGGKRRSCVNCGLCKGNALNAKSVAIVDHGPSSPQRKELLQIGRLNQRAES